MIAATTGVGLLVGLHVATWGAYKDSPYEGFRLPSYARSIALAATMGLMLAVLPNADRLSLVTTVGLVYTMERLVTEWWKTIVRENDQDVYSIPMRLGYRGKPVDSLRRRYLVGAIIVAALGAAIWLSIQLQRSYPAAPVWLIVVTFGGSGGWVTAIGGAWKDAPIEGFSGWKFLRSPVVATAWSAPLSLVTTDWFVLALASGGFAVASIETYKTFLTNGRPPGKFADQPILFTLPRLRRTCARMHAALWATLAAVLIATVVRPADGIARPGLRALWPTLPTAVLLAGATFSCGLSLLVAWRDRRVPSERTASGVSPAS